MSKNNLVHVILAIFMGAIAIGVNAQSIGELAEAAKLRQIGGSVAPGPGPSPAVQSDSPPKAVMKTPAMLVTSIFTSKELNQAGISINGVEVFVRVGDGLISGWVVNAIAGDEVLLKRCSVSKRCETKRLTYTLTN